ncbi:peptidyl-prolyl cis-trans isomerase [Candidatus Poribacteria bacterium]
MRRIISVGAVFLLLALSYVFGGCSQKVQQGNILAEFGDQTVTLDEFQKELSELPDRDKRKYEGQEGLAEYLTLMAESRMLLEVANDNGLDRDKEIVKQVAEYKDQLIVKELVKREVDDQVNVTDTDLAQYYEEHKADYVDPEKVVVTEITLKDEEKAKEILEKAKGGADFTELAKEMDEKGESAGPGQGNGGKSRPFSQDSYRTAQGFVEAAFALEVNQMSDIIVQPLGEDILYMIIRLDERIPSKQKEFSEVKSRIERIVQKEQKKAQMDRWLEVVKMDKNFQLYPERIPEPAETETEAVEGTEAGEKTEAETEKTEEAGTKEEEAVEKKDEQETSGEAVEEKSEE